MQESSALLHLASVMSSLHANLSVAAVQKLFMLVCLLPGVLSSPPPPAQPPSCPNTCLGAPEHANDGECDDGGPGSDYSVCAFGALCAGSNLSPQPAPCPNPTISNPRLLPTLT